MATIVPLAGKTATLTMNSVAVLLTRGAVRINSTIIEYAHTGMTADADSQYWLEIISGLNSWSVEADGYVDHNAVAASRLIGDSIKFRPGTGGSGTFAVLFGTTHGFSGTVIVEEIEQAYDVEGSKPDTFRVRLRGDGAIIYTNT